MKKLKFAGTFIFLFGLFSCITNNAKAQDKNTYLLIHAAWHGACCWEE